MAQYESVIGLEVHAQLRTATKIFCACSTQFGADPNENVCPVCTGMPGVLPVLNRRAVEFAIKMSLAVDCRVNNRSVFARKNYFYPDLPKGYQISQYEQPVAEHGHIDIVTEAGKKVIGITRIHMEEDAGKSIHVPAENVSLVDLNRTGVPLIEIVSDPDMRSPEEAVAYLKALRSILVYLDICDGNMEEGSFRCDANVSLRPRGESALGTRTELKNMNSFRHVQKALEFEIKRQAGLLEDGEVVVQETRLYDADKGVTKPMRGKEEAHDYRYFPDPDLMPLCVSDAWIEEVRSTLPELPAKKKERFVTDFGLSESEAVLLTSERELADYFESAVGVYPEPKKIGNWMMSDFLRMMNEENIPVSKIPMAPKHLAGLVKLVESGAISGKIGKSIFSDLFRQNIDPEAYVRDKGLVQISDTSSLEATVAEVVAAHPEEAAAYRAGKTKLMGFFVGQVMKQTKGQANPKLLNEILIKKLS